MPRAGSVLARTAALTTLTGALALASCGGRSQLFVGTSRSAPEGTGGAAAPSTSTSASAGGAGGAAWACADLFLSGEPITYDPTPDGNGSRPVLVRADASGEHASVVFQWTPEGPGDPVTTRLENATFAPWGSWPAGLGPFVQVSPFFGDPFAAAPAVSGTTPGFAVLIFVPTDAFPSDMLLAPAVVADTSYDYLPPGVMWDAWEPAWPVALARGAQGHLAAYQIGMVSGAYLRLGFEGFEGPLAVTPLDDVACADAPFPADVAPTDGGFLVATAAGRPFGECQLDDDIPGPADELQVLRVDDAAQEVALAASFEGPDRIAHVALAPRAGGAWLVWQHTGESAEAPPPIQAVLLDASGAPVGPVFDVTKDGQTSGPFAAAALGPWLAVAWVDAIDPSTPTLRLDLFDETGTLRTGSSLDTAPSWLFDPSLSLLASPDGAQLLLAWSDVDPPAAATARVARFSCASGL